MKYILLFSCLSILSLKTAHGQNVGIGVITPQVKLHVDGALGTIPAAPLTPGGTVPCPNNASVVWVNLSVGGGTTTITIPSSPTAGQWLAIYNHDDNDVIFDGTSILPGQSRLFIYVNGAWRVISGGSAAANAWNIGGNAISSPATDWIGTSNNQNFVIRANNVERMRVQSNGLIAIGGNTDAPNTLVDIVGGTSGVVTNLLTVRSDYTADGTGTGIRLINSTSATSNVGAEMQAVTIVAANGRSDLVWKVHGGGGINGGLHERARLMGNSTLQIGTPDIRSGTLRLYSEQGMNDFTLDFKPHASMTQNVVLTFPPDDGNNNQVLTTDGNGNLSWTTPTGGSLPPGSAGQTLRHDGTDWVASGAITNDGSVITFNGDFANQSATSNFSTANQSANFGTAPAPLTGTDISVTTIGPAGSSAILIAGSVTAQNSGIGTISVAKEDQRALVITLQRATDPAFTTVTNLATFRGLVAIAHTAGSSAISCLNLTTATIPITFLDTGLAPGTYYYRLFASHETLCGGSCNFGNIVVRERRLAAVEFKL
jgi:hypothetical protein